MGQKIARSLAKKKVKRWQNIVKHNQLANLVVCHTRKLHLVLLPPTRWRPKFFNYLQPT